MARTASQQIQGRLTFDPKYHAYWWDGTIYVPSVTQILDSNGYISHFGKSDTHAERGTEIHEMVHLEIKRLMDGRSVKGQSKIRLSELKAKYPVEFDQFTDFHTELDIQFIETEVMIHGSISLLEYRPGPYRPDYAGTGDIFGMFRKTGQLLDADIKSGLQPPPHTRLQLAAYTLGQYPLNYAEVKRAALTLHATKKKYKLKPYENVDDFAEWIKECKRYQRNNPANLS